MSAFDENSDLVFPQGEGDEPDQGEEEGRRARSSRKRFFARHAKSSAVLATLGIHIALMFAALSLVVFTVVQREEEEERFAFQQVEQQREQVKRRGIPVNIRKKEIAETAMPRFAPVRYDVKTTVQLPELPGMKGGLGYPSAGAGLRGIGLGSEIDFFGIVGGGGHVVFIIDYSVSMHGEKDRIMRREVSRIIQGLSRETHFSVIMFAGPAWPAGSGLRVRMDKWVSTGSGAHSYRPKDWNDMPKARYKKASLTAVSGIIEEVEYTPLAWGTVYDNPIFMALSMDPIPDTIFFMTDGECDDNRGIISLQMMVDQLNASGKKVPVMHTVGFGVLENEQLEAMAELMGGECQFLTAREYIRKYGRSRKQYKPRYSEGDDFESIESVPADQYPVEFSLH